MPTNVWYPNTITFTQRAWAINTAELSLKAQQKKKQTLLLKTKAHSSKLGEVDEGRE